MPSWSSSVAWPVDDAPFLGGSLPGPRAISGLSRRKTMELAWSGRNSTAFVLKDELSH
jgi:hypothetical protein